MVFSRRKTRHRLPPPPSPELVEKVREVETTAELQLETAESREEEIDRRTDRVRAIRRENALGPRFWQAVGEHRGT